MDTMELEFSGGKASGQVTSMADFISMCDKPAFRHQASFTKSNGCKERLGLQLSRGKSCDLLRRVYQTSIELEVQ